MQSIEQRILAYPHLTDEEQADVEAYVTNHPEWRDLLRDVKELEVLARQARLLKDRPPQYDVLALYVVATRLHQGPSSSAMQRTFDAVKARLDDDADYRAQYDLLQQRMDEVEAAFDPLAQFEALSGHRLSQPPADRGGTPKRERAQRRPASSRRSSDTSTAGQSMMARLITRPALQWAAAAVVVLFTGYSALFATSYITQSPGERLAANLEVTEISGYSTRTRSAEPQLERRSPDQLFLEALPLVRNARSTTLGLFPRYDAEKLARAEELLQEVVIHEDAGDFLQLEALFYLGKVHLAQGRLEEARSNFKAVVTGEGRRMADALRTLEELQQAYPAQPQDAR